jgi:Flp pilus assembly protein TadB
MQLSPFTFSLLTGAVLVIMPVLLFSFFTRSIKETEQKRLERQEKMQEKLAKIKAVGYRPELADQARRAGWSITFNEYLMISGGAFLVMLIIGALLRNVFVAAGGGLVAYMLPRYLIKLHRKKEYKLKVRLLKPAIQAIASAHTFKPNILSAIQYAVPSMQEPIKRDFEIFLYDVETGTPLKDALLLLRKRVNIRYLDFFIRVISMSEEEGGSAHELIKTCAEIIDQDMLVMAEFETEISAEKKTTYQLLLLQYVVLGFLGVSQPAAYAAFTGTLFGQVFILYVMASSLIVYSLAEKYTDTSLEEAKAGV